MLFNGYIFVKLYYIFKYILINSQNNLISIHSVLEVQGGMVVKDRKTHTKEL